MSVRTKRRHTKTRPKSKSRAPDMEKSISGKEYVKKACGDLPQWAVYLAGLRYRENLTQKELGEKIDVKQSNISLMERGLRPIGKNIAQRLAKVFNTDYRLFL
jgi:DNA-binding XRE family transcriptional regulator